MREIKFRGKINGGWVYGGIEEEIYPLNPNKFYIIVFNDWGLNQKVEVDPKTVGQFTGLRDINGKELYDGDIVRDDEDGMDYIEWSEYYCGWVTNQWFNSSGLAKAAKHLEIIGNKFDNKDLLK